MKDLHTEKSIKDIKDSLYDRGKEVEQLVRHELTDNKIDVSRNWDGANSVKKINDPRSGEREYVQTNSEVDVAATDTPPRRYRRFILGGSILILILVTVISAGLFFFGGNGVSSENISIAITGQPLIGGGEVMSLQVSIDNQNRTSLEAATLILKYPPSTRSTSQSSRNLYEERIPLNNIGSGEVQNIPIRVIVYGENNAEQQIEATIEYRMSGSNGVFYKKAEPLAYRISSAPLSVRVETVEKVASGQLIDIVVFVSSNASTPLKDILLTASYPSGFSYEEAVPDSVYGENTWKIAELLPEEVVEIALQGVITGLTEEKLIINFTVGTANVDNQYLVDAVLDKVSTEFVIERPFIDVGITVGNKTKNIVLSEAEQATVNLNIVNTLDETVYDMIVEVVPEGNVLVDNSISSTNGFYDSNTGTVRWEVSNNRSFERVLPGSARSLEFSVTPGPQRTTASFGLEVNVYARRVAESSASETLIGSNRVEVKYSSHITLGSQASHQATDGPVPPKVGEITAYMVTLAVEAGGNNVTDAVMNTSLPIYVKWLNEYTGDGDLVYNSVSKKIQWIVGDLELNTRKEVSFKVELQPSMSQAGSIPALVNNQSLKANDLFTGALLQDSAPAVTTELSSEMGYEKDNGGVIR